MKKTGKIQKAWQPRVATPSLFPEPSLASSKLWQGCRVGLLGGSFNPAHLGHAHISTIALKKLGLHAVWWLVSPQNPLKTAREMASLKTRATSAKKSLTHPRLVTSCIEQSLGTQYTADTLLQLKKRFPKTEFVWLMGADNLQQIDKWDRYKQIFQTVPIAIFDRPAYTVKALRSKAARVFKSYGQVASRPCLPNFKQQAACQPWHFFPIPQVSLSSTMLRSHLGVEWTADSVYESKAESESS